ncbi:MAG: hypothetical protein AAF585_12550 [Verrucomicrobiota bacterium]
MKSVPKRRAAAVSVFVIFASVVGWLLQDRTELVASPTERRHFANELKEWRNAPLPPIAADENQRAELPDRAWVQLKAVALSVPVADDPEPLPWALKADGPFEDLLFRNPASSAALELEIPQAWKEINPSRRNRPQIRLVLEFSSDSKWVLPENGVRLWDARTHASVLRGWTNSSHRNLMVLDLGIGIWHDTSLILGLMLSRNLDSALVTLPITGLPDMPNGRDVENLFDIRIPRVTIESTGWSYPAGHNMEFRKFLTEAVELQLEEKGVISDLPYVFPGSHIDVMPRELLAEYGRLHKRAIIQVNPQTHTIEIEYRDTWLQKTRKWWNSWAPVEWPEI